MYTSKPPYPFSTIPTIDDLENSHKTTTAAKKELSKTTNFLMEFMKFIPQAEAVLYATGNYIEPQEEGYDYFKQWDREFFNQADPFGKVSEDEFTAVHAKAKALYAYFKELGGIDDQGNIQTSFQDTYPDAVINLFSKKLMENDGIEPLSSDVFLKLLDFIRKCVARGITGPYAIQEILPEELAYFSESQPNTGVEYIKRVLWANSIYTIIRRKGSNFNSYKAAGEDPVGFGSWHRQGSPYLGAGAGAYCEGYSYTDAFYSFDHIDEKGDNDDLWNDMSGVNLSVMGKQNNFIGEGVVPVWSPYQSNNRYYQTYNASTDNYDFNALAATDYTNLMVGLNPVLLKKAPGQDVAPTFVDYKNYFSDAKGYFNGMYTSNDYLEYYGKTLESQKNHSPSFYQLAMDPTAPWNKYTDSDSDGVLDANEVASCEYGANTWWNGKSADAGKISFYLAVLMAESKRRAFTSMTQLFGPHTQFIKNTYAPDKGNNSYVKNRYSYEEKSPQTLQDGTANPEYGKRGMYDSNGDGTLDTMEPYNYNGELDSLMMNLSKKYWDTFSEESSYLRQGFLSLFLLAAHSLTQATSLFSGYDSMIYSARDRNRVGNFRTWISANYDAYKPTFISGIDSDGTTNNIMTDYASYFDSYLDGAMDSDDGYSQFKNSVGVMYDLIGGANKEVKYAYLKLPTYRVCELIQQFKIMIDAWPNRTDLVAVDGDTADQLSVKAGRLAQLRSYADMFTSEMTNLKNGYAYDELKKEVFYSGQESEYLSYKYMPLSFYARHNGDGATSWDVTLGNVVSNVGVRADASSPVLYSDAPYTKQVEQIVQQHHWYAIAQQVSNYNVYQKTDSVKVNFEMYGTHTYYGNLEASGYANIQSAIPYQTIWMSRGVIEANMIAQRDINTLMFAVDKARKDRLKYRSRLEDYVKEKMSDEEEQIKGEAIAERRQREADARAKRAFEKNRQERAAEFKKSLSRFAKASKKK